MAAATSDSTLKRVAQEFELPEVSLTSPHTRLCKELAWQVAKIRQKAAEQTAQGLATKEAMLHIADDLEGLLGG